MNIYVRRERLAWCLGATLGIAVGVPVTLFLGWVFTILLAIIILTSAVLYDVVKYELPLPPLDEESSIEL